MNIIEFRDYCLSKEGVTEDTPFDETTLAFRLENKIFALTGLDAVEPRVNLKCDPEWALELRSEYPEEIYGGYHMNKKHWNSVKLEGRVPLALICKMVDHSYELILKSLPKKLRIKYQ